MYRENFITEFVKTALTAAKRHSLAKKHGVKIVPGTPWKWAVKQRMRGKTFEQMGAEPFKERVKNRIQQARTGKEYSSTYSKGKTTKPLQGTEIVAPVTITQKEVLRMLQPGARPNVLGTQEAVRQATQGQYRFNSAISQRERAMLKLRKKDPIGTAHGHLSSAQVEPMLAQFEQQLPELNKLVDPSSIASKRKGPIPFPDSPGAAKRTRAAKVKRIQNQYRKELKALQEQTKAKGKKQLLQKDLTPEQKRELGRKSRYGLFEGEMGLQERYGKKPEVQLEGVRELYTQARQQAEYLRDYLKYETGKDIGEKGVKKIIKQITSGQPRIMKSLAPQELARRGKGDVGLVSPSALDIPIFKSVGGKGSPHTITSPETPLFSVNTVRDYGTKGKFKETSGMRRVYLDDSAVHKDWRGKE